RPYCMSDGGNVLAERPPKTPKVKKGHTVARDARHHPLKDACFSPFLRLVRSSQDELKGN
ncbi:hypothetical protein, partial [Shigella sonnei]|uniref:hypothetical protein n=1 Tax=Shigella sonnei TaxID=624 RepID=UPI001C2EC2A5